MNRIHRASRLRAPALAAVLLTMTAAVSAHASPNFQTILRKDPASTPTNADQLTWTLNLSEGVRYMDPTDFVVSGTTATLTLSPATECLESYEATLSGGDLAGLNGTVTLTVSEDQNIWGCLGEGEEMTHPGPLGANDNTFVVDNAAPALAITGVPGNSTGAFTATFTFGEAVTGFQAGDVSLSGGTAGAFSGSGATYTLEVTPDADYTISVASAAATDAAGNGNAAASAGGTFSGPPPRFQSIQRQSPATSPTNADQLTWRLSLSEGVRNLDAADFGVSGTTAALTLSPATECLDSYEATLSGGDLAGLNGTVTLTVSAGQDIQGCTGDGVDMVNPAPTGANDNTFVVDNLEPALAITGVPDRTAQAFTATFTFGEAVTGFQAGDVSLSGGTAGAFSGSGATYTLEVRPNADYRVSVSADAATDAAGNGNAAASAGGTFIRPVPPPVNGAPTGSPMADRTVSVGQVLSLNVAGYFTDPDNDELSFSASSDDESKVKVTTSGSSVTISAAGAGAARVAVTARDPEGAGATVRFKVTSLLALRTASIEDQYYTQGKTIDVLTLPAAAVEGPSMKYSLTPALPAGLSFDGTARTISGTPTAAMPRTAYTYQLTDNNGNTAHLTFHIAVDGVPDFADGTVSDQDYTQYAPIDSLTLPAAVGGDGGLTYSLSPELPAGLSFDGTARTISGTPAAALAATAYTFTATDADGDTANLAFDITVAAATAHTLGKAGGDEQQGQGGAPLAEPFVVSVLDQAGNPYPGAAVAFAVTAGEGSLSATRDTTDAGGRAAATLTLGRTPGTNTVEVTVAGLDPVTFTATAKAASDFNGDGVTDFSDFFLFADAFGGSDPRFDLDGSGSVDFADLFLLAEQFDQPARAKLVAMAREMIGLPGGPQLQQNAPNPFNSRTVISYDLLAPGAARVEVFALTGQRVAVLHEGLERPAGTACTGTAATTRAGRWPAECTCTAC